MIKTARRIANLRPNPNFNLLPPFLLRQFIEEIKLSRQWDQVRQSAWKRWQPVIWPLTWNGVSELAIQNSISLGMHVLVIWSGKKCYNSPTNMFPQIHTAVYFALCLIHGKEKIGKFSYILINKMAYSPKQWQTRKHTRWGQVSRRSYRSIVSGSLHWK